jgi:predicted methyltransferase
MIHRRFAGALALAVALAFAPPAIAKPRPAAYAAALADPARPAADRERDAARKPAELLAFAGIKPGQKVGDWVMGGGYLTRVVAAAVGPKGRVYAFQPAEFIAFRKQYGEDQKAVDAAYANVDAVSGSIASPAVPAKLDAVITVQNFHDMYHKFAPEGTQAKAMKAVYDALKPGGVLVVVDHAAAPGSTAADWDKVHRVDKQAVIAIVTGVGFKLDGESDLFANPADPRTANVFDASIRGKTDQFALRFRKPK